MRIEDLDEFQGVTPQLVTDWLTANGWVQTKFDPLCWGNGKDHLIFDPDTFHEMPYWANTIARVCGCDLQAVLRKINPRMRLGKPSDAALKAHNGLWMCRENAEGSTLQIIDCSHGRMALPPSATANMLFWPIDNDGNKVRWSES